MKKENKTLYTNLSVTDLGSSEIEINAEIPFENLEPFKVQALKKLGKNAKIPGFRPGHIPENILAQRLGEQGILEETAELALQKVYPDILRVKELRVIGRPTINIMKLATGNPFVFKINVALIPDVALPDYKKIANVEMAVVEKVDVDDEEVENVIHDIRKTRTKTQRIKEGKPADEEIKDKDLLPLTDEFVKTLGEFKTVEDFKTRVKENMLKEKELHVREKKRISIGEKIIEGSTIDLPQVLIDAELEKMNAQFRDDVARMGVEFNDYLKKINKTEEDLRIEWKDNAIKRAKLQLIVNNIATKENLFPNKKEIEEQVAHLKQHYQDAAPERIKIYVETLLTNEKVFEFLERQGKGKGKEKHIEN